MHCTAAHAFQCLDPAETWVLASEGWWEARR